MSRTGDVAILRFSFAFFRVDERYGDFATVAVERSYNAIPSQWVLFKKGTVRESAKRCESNFGLPNY
jgi:hypothetical protein